MKNRLKIGEFAKLFQVPTSTIRYYISFGILVPETKNTQYLFTPECQQDMEFVEKLKEMKFSLNDILSLITMKRKFSIFREADFKNCLTILLKHKEYLECQLEMTYEQEKMLKALIHP